MLSELAALTLLGAMALLGVAALRRARLGLTPLEEIAYGGPLGVVAASLALLGLGVLFGLSREIVVGVGLLSVVGAAALWPGISWGAVWAALQTPPVAGVVEGAPAGAGAGTGRGPGTGTGAGLDWRGMRAPRVWPFRTGSGSGSDTETDAWADQTGWSRIGAILPMLVIGAFAVRWAFLWSGALTYETDGLWVGQINIWGDWPQHLGDTTAFAYGDNFPPEHPRYAGIPYAYHYLSSLTAAAMVMVGMDPVHALTLHSFVFSLFIALGVYALARRLAVDRAVATLALVLFLLGGGFGWLLTADRIDGIGSIWSTVWNTPWDLAAQKDNNFRWENIYLANIEPQRAQTYGLPLSFLVLALLHQAIRSGERRVFLAAGIAAGFLPFAHLGPLPALGLIALCLAVMFPRPLVNWIVFFGVWGGLTLPQLLTQRGGGGSVTEGVRFHVGWVAPPHDPAVWFWLKNLGWFAPLLLIALARRDLVPPLTRRVLWAFTPVFLVANLVSFQPDPFDNVKMLVYWFLAVCILVAALLVTVWRGRGPGVRVLIGGVVATMLLSGILVNVEQARGLDRYRWATTEEIALAAEVRAVTPPGSVFVVGLRHDHPIPMLTGRPVVMSFPGWIWTRGLDAATREADIRAIYALGPETPALLARYDAAYVVIGPDEVNGFGADPAAWRARYRVLIETGSYLVLDVR